MVLKGIVDSIIFRNQDNGYSVISFNTTDSIFTAVGVLPPITEGEELELKGDIVLNSKYGEQFSIKEAKICLPTNSESIARYLASGLFKGIGEATADAIVEKYGDKTLFIVENAPMEIAKVKGVSAKKAMLIHETFLALKEIQDTLVFLQGLEISLNLSLKIYKVYGKGTTEIIKTNPYRLIEDIDGVGFLTADKIAFSLGIKQDSDFRIKAGIIYSLKMSANNNGHTYLPKSKLINEVCKLLALEIGNIEERIAENILALEITGSIVVLEKDSENAVMFNKFYLNERKIATKLVKLCMGAMDLHTDIESDMQEFERTNFIIMHENQKEAVKNAISCGVNVITGGPGTGKTTIIKCIISIFKKLNLKVQLCAPTGRASKRLSESTGEDAKTIHRLLDLDYKDGKGYFTYNEQTELESDVIIIDEVSMCDEYVFVSLLSAIKRGGRLIMVGDKDQLPSVGAGNVLADIIKYGFIPISMLTHIYRQSEESLIISNAHRINHGEMPLLRNQNSDFLYSNVKEQQEVLDTVVDMVTTRIPNYLKIKSSDIQVLCPMKKGVAGANNMNITLQKTINPPSYNKPELKFMDHIFRLGDKVIHTVNDYDLEWERGEERGMGVFNGDFGFIEEVNIHDNTINVEFEDGRRALYTRDIFEELMLAYAVSVHKSQGSEFDVVVIALVNGSFMMLTRNLLYTAVTRAKKMSVIVGDKVVLEKMVSNNYTAKRYTMLVEFLMEEHERQCLN